MRQRLSRLIALRASLRPLPSARRLFLRQQQHLFLCGYRRGEAGNWAWEGGGVVVVVVRECLPALAAVEEGVGGGWVREPWPPLGLSRGSPFAHSRVV